MSKQKRVRIDTNPKSEGLQNPFASLDALGLPPGETPANPPTPAQTDHAPKLGRVVLRKETAHRGGKAVIVIHDFAPHLTPQFIETLGRKLRKTLNCGGSIRDRVVELQGDHPERIRTLLEAEGFRVAGIK